MIEAAIAKSLLTAKLEWHDWHKIRDGFKPELRVFIDDKLRLHSRGAIDFEASDNKLYIVIRPKQQIEHFNHLVFYRAKDGNYSMMAAKDGLPVTKGMMMLGFSEALQK